MEISKSLNGRCGWELIRRSTRRVFYKFVLIRELELFPARCCVFRVGKVGKEFVLAV